MKKALFIILLSLLSNLMYGQYTDTATMRIIEQNRSANEGDLYLDTNAKVFKIGLTNGKLGWLTDNQNFDSIRVLRDSLFVFLQRGNKAGIPVDLLKSTNSSDSGLQYYTWNIANTATPDVSNKRTIGIPTSQGRTEANLDNTLRGLIAPDTDGYIICLMGTLVVKNTGNFTFESTSDDGTRIYIDGAMVLESWFDQGSTIRSNSVNLTVGEHKIEFWYYENTGFDDMQFRWRANPDGYTSGSIIKASQFVVK